MSMSHPANRARGMSSALVGNDVPCTEPPRVSIVNRHEYFTPIVACPGSLVSQYSDSLLKWRDLQFAGAQPSVMVRYGKGGRYRVVPAHPELVDAFRSVLCRSIGQKGFMGRASKPMSSRTAARRISEGIHGHGITGGRHGNQRRRPGQPQPTPQLRPPLTVIRPERQHCLRPARPQQSDCNPQHLPGNGTCQGRQR